MQSYFVEKDVSLLVVQAASFPDGVAEAWKSLHALLVTTTGRGFYGVSHGAEGGAIVYKACVEERHAGEAERYGCERLVLPAGEYSGRVINNFMQRLPEIGQTFHALLSGNDYDPKGACVEKYLDGNDVLCMVKRK